MRSQFSRFFLLIFFFSSCTFIVLPSSVSAAGLIPCGRTGADATAAEKAPCTICHVIIGGNRIIEYGLQIMTVVAIAVMVAMGIFYIISAGNDEMMKTAKGGIKAALIGFAVMLGAWLIINTTLRIFSATIPGLGITNTGFTFSCDSSSNAGTAIPLVIPAVPSMNSSHRTGTTVVINFGPSVAGGGVATSYTITCTPMVGTGPSITGSSTASPITVIVGAMHSCTMTATNAAGTSAASAPYLAM